MDVSPDPDAETAPRAAFRFPAWLIVPAGLAVGVVAGTYSYLLQRWMSNGRVHSPIGDYAWVIAFNLVVWIAWFG
jgi:hypothetical protein